MPAVQLSTFLSPPKPVPTTASGWDRGRRATWPATTSSLLAVGGRGVLVDALMTLAEGDSLADWVLGTRTRLATVYVTHAHADHFFGATSLLRRVPGARLVTRPEVVADAALQAGPEGLRVWNSSFPGQVPPEPLLPDGVDGDLQLGSGPLIRPVLVGGSDTAVSSVVHVPDLGVVLAGDVVYDGVHPWLVGSTARTRAGWLAALDAVEHLAPRTIVAGHRDPAAADAGASRLLDETRQYVADFGRAAEEADGPGDLVARIMATHGGLDNEYTLWLAAQSQFTA